MSLTHAILTSLLEKPCTGAELARRFDKSLGLFWQATHQQIYRELGAMESAGLVESQGLPSTRGQQKHFAVLPRGHAALQGWCGEEGEPRPVRDALLVRLRAAAVLGTEAAAASVLEQMRHHRRIHEQALAAYLDIGARDFPAGAPRPRAQELQAAVLNAGISYESAWLAWCEQALVELARAGEGRAVEG